MPRWNTNHPRKTWAFLVLTASGKRTSFTLSNPKDIEEATRLAHGASATLTPSELLTQFVKRAASSSEAEELLDTRGAFAKFVRSKLFKMLRGAYRPELVREKEEATKQAEYFSSEDFKNTPEYIHGVNSGFIDPDTGKYKE